jgi:hypothetical protein
MRLYRAWLGVSRMVERHMRATDAGNARLVPTLVPTSDVASAVAAS